MKNLKLLFIFLFEKYKDFLSYAFLGMCTTVLNIVVYYIAAHAFYLRTTPSTVIAWIVSILFAYVTNRKWVFHSEANGLNEIFHEMVSFFVMRLGTGFVDWLCMSVFVDVLRFDDVLIKTLANVIVIILNYVASKLVIFKKRQ